VYYTRIDERHVARTQTTDLSYGLAICEIALTLCRLFRQTASMETEIDDNYRLILARPKKKRADRE